MQNDITKRIECVYRIEMTFADNNVEVVRVYRDCDNCYIMPIGFALQKISETHFAEILAMSDLSIDGDIRDGKGLSTLSNNSFFSKYYNIVE